MNRTANGANKRLALLMQLRCGSLSITTSVSLLANELDVRSVLHGQVGLAAANHICVIHEAMNGSKTQRLMLDPSEVVKTLAFEARVSTQTLGVQQMLMHRRNV